MHKRNCGTIFFVHPFAKMIWQGGTMEFIKAIIMGIIQGVAEFLPISSSGHLAIFKILLKMETDTGMLFDVLLHLGTLAAVFIVFWQDIKSLIVEGFSLLFDCAYNIGCLFRKEKKYRKVVGTPYRRFVMLIIVSTIPTGIIGILMKDVIELSAETLLVPGCMLLLTGVLLTIADRISGTTITEKDASYGKAALIGTAQGIATMPGLSRSGTTIAACLLCGFDRNFAVRYSFIMSIPAILGALLLELLDFSAATVGIGAMEWAAYGVGTVVSGVVGYICIKTMLVIVRGKKFKYFAWYCFAMGIIAIVGHFVS